MQDRAQIKEMLLQSRQSAARHLENIRQAVPLKRDVFDAEMRQYILCKYMLEGVECNTDNFNELTELSLSRSMKVSKELVEEFDTAQSCDGATSAMAKKVLLFMNIERELNIQIPAEQSAKNITLEQLIALIWGAMAETEVWKGKLAV